DAIFFIRGSLDRLDGQRRIVQQEIEAVEPMPRGLLASETVCDRLPSLLAKGILNDRHHRCNCKQLQEESAFHVISNRSMDSIPADFNSPRGDCTMEGLLWEGYRRRLDLSRVRTRRLAIPLPIKSLAGVLRRHPAFR